MTNADRTLTEVAKSAGSGAQQALSKLQDAGTLPADYRAAMHVLGKALGQEFARHESVRSLVVCLVMTVEDADFLGQGVMESLESAGADIRIACLWNERVKHKPWADLAPVVQEYRDPVPKDVDYLIVLKSIISGACVVKTNLQHMLEEVTPKHIHVMAPVMLQGAEERLGKEFPAHLAEQFHYWALAIDSKKDADGNVIPGVGGEVYSRLGLGGPSRKNAFLPQLVSERMERRQTGSL